MGQFLFSKYKTIKRLHILNDLCWVFDWKAWFLKDLFQNWYLSHFILTIRIDMTFEIWDLIPEQERLLNKEEHRLSLWNPWHEWHWNFSTLLEKLSSQGQYSGPWKGETNSMQISWGEKKESDDELWKSIKVMN